MKPLTRSILTILLFFFLIACDESPSSSTRLAPQRVPTPAANELRKSVEFGGLLLGGNRQRCVVVLVHSVLLGQLPVSARYPSSDAERPCIDMNPANISSRSDIQQSWLTIPKSQADGAAMIVTILAVPDTVDAWEISAVSRAVTALVRSYASSILINPISSFIAGEVINTVSDAVTQRIREGEVLGIYRIKLHADGAPSIDVIPGAQPVSLSVREIVLAPVLATTPGAQASPRRVNIPTSPVPLPSEDDVVNVVRRFNADQTIAVRDLNIDLLLPTSSGAWLKLQRRYIEELKLSDMYEVQKQIDFKVLSVKVSGDTASVITHETWDTRKYHHNSDRGCVFYQHFSNKQTYRLVHKLAPDRWLITNIRGQFPRDARCQEAP